MTNKIMELADAYANRDTRTDVELKARAELATEVQAHIDYTRAVVNERDAYKTSLEATKGEVYRLLSERDAYQVEADKLAAENKQLRDQVHTCHAGCSKAGCIVSVRRSTYGANTGNGLGDGRNRYGGRSFDWCLPVMRQQCGQVFVQ